MKYAPFVACQAVTGMTWGQAVGAFYLANSDLNDFGGPLLKFLLQGYLLNLRFEVGPQ